MIEFTIPGAPVGKGRPRIIKIAGHAAMKTPEKTANYESLVALAAHRAMGGAPMLLGPCSVRLAIWTPVPASWSQKKQRAALAGEVLPTTKPDIDNVEKAIFDALNGVVWKDDVQVVDVTKSKRYGVNPCVAVMVREVQQALQGALA